MTDLARLKQQLDELRKRRTGLISIANAEWYSLLRDEIRNSIAIEGVFANRNDLLDVLVRHKKTSRQKTAAILGYFESAGAMYEYANNQFKENEFGLRLSDIKQIHTLLMRYEKEAGSYTGDLGEFRKGDIQVAQATFRPVDAFYVRPAMELLIQWFNRAFKLRKNDRDAVRLAAISHVWFETIHPFRDGNGRAGRILLSYSLIGAGWLNIAIKGTNRTDRDKYYRALEAADDCFEDLHRRIESGEKTGLRHAEEAIAKGRFDAMADMVQDRLTDSVRRLNGPSSADANPDTDAPLRDVARIFNFSQDYLRNLINRRRIKAHKRGKLWYLYLRDIRHYVKMKK